MSHACAKAKTCVASNHACARVYNKCTTHTHTYPYEIFATITILLTTSSALNFTIYTCRNILDVIVTDILGHLRHTAFVATCSYVAGYVHSSHKAIASYI